MSADDRVRCVVITTSDASSKGEREDLSGPAVEARLRAAGFTDVERVVVPDEGKEIAGAVLAACDMGARLVITTGGTGVGRRDVTPEACSGICDRRIEGFGELMRLRGSESTPRAWLSRGGAWTLGTALVVNLPGSPRGAIESLEAILELIPHSLELLAGNTAHPAR